MAIIKSVLHSFLHLLWFSAVATAYFKTNYESSYYNINSVLDKIAITYLHLVIYANYIFFTSCHMLHLLSKFYMISTVTSDIILSDITLLNTFFSFVIILDTPYKSVCRLINLYTDSYPLYIVTLEDARTYFPFLATLLFTIILFIHFDYSSNKDNNDVEDKEEIPVTRSRYNLRSSKK